LDVRVAACESSKLKEVQNGTTDAANLPKIGTLARVRQRLYLVENVRPPVEPGDSALVSLACVEDDAQGQTLDVLWDIVC
jgi:hypothetical protein